MSVWDTVSDVGKTLTSTDLKTVVIVCAIVACVLGVVEIDQVFGPYTKH